MPQRTITYNRADWPMPMTATLQAAIAACLAERPDATQTRLPLRTGLAEVRHRAIHTQKVQLHIAAWTPDEAMSTVPNVPIGPTADLSSEPPGGDWDYLGGDGMVLISENHYLSMSSGLHQKSIEQYIRNLLGSQPGDHEDAAQFQLYAVTNTQIIREIQRQGGPKKINLNIGQYRETDLGQSERATIIERLGRDMLLNLVAEDETREDILAAENVSAKLIITLDRRRPGITPEYFAPITEQIASESEDEIEIETFSGHRIRRGQLILKKAVDVDQFARTVHHQHAWELMDEYLRELQQSGMLEQ